MKVVFIAGALWLAYVYAGYPLLLALLALRRRVRPLLSSEVLPSVSVMIAAHNEEKDIGWKIAETLGWDYPADKLEVLVGCDGCDDSTDEVVRRLAGPRVSLVRIARRGGKARALNRLAELARGEILFFTDANAHIGPGALRLTVRHFADRRVGCVTGDSRPIEEMESTAVSSGASAYWNYEILLKRLENRLGSVLVCDGAIFCLRAALYHRLSPDLANDLELPMCAAAAGYMDYARTGGALLRARYRRASRGIQTPPPDVRARHAGDVQTARRDERTARMAVRLAQADALAVRGSDADGARGVGRAGGGLAFLRRGARSASDLLWPGRAGIGAGAGRTSGGTRSGGGLLRSARRNRCVRGRDRNAVRTKIRGLGDTRFVARSGRSYRPGGREWRIS